MEIEIGSDGEFSAWQKMRQESLSTDLTAWLGRAPES